MKIDTWWFKERLRSRELSQRQLAFRIGMDPSALSLTLRGKRRLALQEAAAIAEELGLSVQDVLIHAGIPVDEISPRQAGMVPVRGVVGDHGVIKAGKGLGHAPAPADAGESTVALTMEASGSELVLMDGWTLYYDGDTDRVPADAVGRLCVCKIDEEDAMVLRFVQRATGRAGATYRTRQLCGREVATERLAWASPVTWMRP